MYQTQTPKTKHWSAPKITATLVAIAAAITATVIIGSRLTDQALAVLAGATCGVGAAIPTSLLIFAISRRQKREELALQPQQYTPVTRPTMMVVPPMVMPSQLPPQPLYGSGSPYTRPPRTFHVVGATGEVEKEYKQ